MKKILLWTAAGVAAITVISVLSDGENNEPTETTRTAASATRPPLTLPNTTRRTTTTRPTTTARTCISVMGTDFTDAQRELAVLSGSVLDNPGGLGNADRIFADSLRLCGEANWVITAALIAESAGACQELWNLFYVAPVGSRMEELALDAHLIC